MSIQSEIDRIKENVATAYSAVEEKGGTVPEEQNSSNLPEAIRSISMELPSGTADQVMGFDDSGQAVPKLLETDMLPIVDVAHGGTGGITGRAALANLMRECYTMTAAAVDGYTMENYRLPIWVSTTNNADAISMSMLRLHLIGTETQIKLPSTDYTTSRARAISLHTTMPASGLVNGALYGIYS